MTGNKYQQLAARTLRRRSILQDMSMTALGLAGESGEVVELVKKVCFHGHQMDLEKLSKELGDVLWYIAAMATVMGVSMDDIMEKNIEKLKARYPDGFSEAASRERKGGE